MTCAWQMKKYEITLKVKVKDHQLPTTSCVHHGAYSYQITSISVQQFSRFCADKQTDRLTPPKTIPAHSMHAGNQGQQKKGTWTRRISVWTKYFTKSLQHWLCLTGDYNMAIKQMQQEAKVIWQRPHWKWCHHTLQWAKISPTVPLLSSQGDWDPHLIQCAWVAKSLHSEQEHNPFSQFCSTHPHDRQTGWHTTLRDHCNRQHFACCAFDAAQKISKYIHF